MLLQFLRDAYSKSTPKAANNTVKISIFNKIA